MATPLGASSRRPIQNLFFCDAGDPDDREDTSDGLYVCMVNIMEELVRPRLASPVLFPTTS